jgi:hypothetical protein
MGYTQATAFVDGELVPISEAKISLLDGICCIRMPPTKSRQSTRVAGWPRWARCLLPIVRSR